MNMYIKNYGVGSCMDDIDIWISRNAESELENNNDNNKKLLLSVVNSHQIQTVMKFMKIFYDLYHFFNVIVT